MATDITSSDDLPFTARDGAGGSVDWHPARSTHSPEAAMRQGLAYAEALAALARVDEHAAWQAAKLALQAREWNGQCAEEDGFADGLARAAVVGWRAMAQGEDLLPFDTHFDPVAAEWHSLHRRVALMEAQLKALGKTPWRTDAEAGLDQ